MFVSLVTIINVPAWVIVRSVKKVSKNGGTLRLVGRVCTVRQVQPLLGVYHFLIRSVEIGTKGKHEWVLRGKKVDCQANYLPNSGSH